MAGNRVSVAKYDALISAIYEAANDSALWECVIERLMGAFDGRGASLRVLDPLTNQPYFSISKGYDEEYQRLYSEHFYQVDVVASGLEAFSQSQVCIRTDALPDKQFCNTEFYQDFLRHWDQYDLIGGHFIKQQTYNARIGVHRPYGHAFSADDKELMRMLMPHLQRAFNINQHIQKLEREAAVTEDSLNLLPFGIALLDHEGKPILVNQQAHAICNINKEINITSKGVTTSLSKDNQMLKQLIRMAIQKKGEQGGVMAVNRRDAVLPLSILVLPLKPYQAPLGLRGAQADAVVYIYDPAYKKPICTELLISLYRLSAAEARLAKELALGKNLDEISDAYSVSKHTLRTQLKSIFNKTGLNSQIDVVRLVLNGPVQFP